MEITYLTHEQIAESTRSPIVSRRFIHTVPGMYARTESVIITTERANGSGGPGVHIQWHPLGRVHPHARVEMFDDCWLAFTELREVFDLLATLDAHLQEKPNTCEGLKTGLRALGFEDLGLSRD
jgi:hypothetical protein